MLKLSEMTEEELKSFVKAMSEEDLYKYIRSDDTDIKLLGAIADAITLYCDDFSELLSTINLPEINILLKDKSLSSKFLDYLESILISGVYQTIPCDMPYLTPLEMIFEHPNTTQEMLRKAYDYELCGYVIDKLNMDDPLNRKLLKENKFKDLYPNISERAFQRLKEDSILKPKAVAVLININSLMLEYRHYEFEDFQTLCNYDIVGSLFQKLSLLLEELSKFKALIGAEKLIFIPVCYKLCEDFHDHLEVFRERPTGKYIPETVHRDSISFKYPIYEYWTEGGYYVHTSKKITNDLVLANSDFCKWFYFCIAKVVNDGSLNKEGYSIIDDDIIFDTGFYYDGYIKVEKSREYGNFNIKKYTGYEKCKNMDDSIVKYIEELATDYKLLQVVDSKVRNSEYEFDSYDGIIPTLLEDEYLCRHTSLHETKKEFDFGNDIPVSAMYPKDYEKTEANISRKINLDGTFLDVSDDDKYSVIINSDGTFSIRVAEKGYDGIIQCYQHLNVSLKEYQELIKQESNNVLAKKFVN